MKRKLHGRPQYIVHHSDVPELDKTIDFYVVPLSPFTASETRKAKIDVLGHPGIKAGHYRKVINADRGPVERAIRTDMKEKPYSIEWFSYR